MNQPDLLTIDATLTQAEVPPVKLEATFVLAAIRVLPGFTQEFHVYRDHAFNTEQSAKTAAASLPSTAVVKFVVRIPPPFETWPAKAEIAQV